MRKRRIESDETELIKETLIEEQDKQNRKGNKALKIAGTVTGTVVGVAVALTVGMCIKFPNQMEQLVYEVTGLDVDINKDGIHGYDTGGTLYGAIRIQDGSVNKKR